MPNTTYTIPHIDGNSFNEDALAYATSASVIYVDGDLANQTINGTTRNYKYILAQTTWIPTYMEDIPTYTPVDVEVGPANTFRTQFNTNFNLIDNQADIVAANIKGVYDDLSPLAFTGAAGDLALDSTHRFVTDTQKQNWGSRLWVDSDKIQQRSWDTTESEFVDTDVTQNVKDILDIDVPEATSELVNDSGFITGSGYVSPEIKMLTNINVTTFETDPNPPASELTKKGTIDFPGCTDAMSAELVYSQSDCDSGDFSSICQTDTDKVYFWCKSTVTEPVVIKAVIITKQSTVTTS